MINIEVRNRVNKNVIAYLQLNYVPPINTHLILSNKEFVIIDYVLDEKNINVLKVIVDSVGSRVCYNGKI